MGIHFTMCFALVHCLEGMDINYIVQSDNALTNVMQGYTNWLDDQFKKQIVDQSVDQKATKSS